MSPGRIVCLFFLFSSLLLRSQDVFIFDSKAYPLVKTTGHYTEINDMLSTIPTEYEETNKTLVIPFTALVPCDMHLVYHEDGSQALIRNCDSLHIDTAKSISLSHFTDSITIDVDRINRVAPVIKSGKHEYNLSAYEIFAIYEGRCTRYYCKDAGDGDIFAPWLNDGFDNEKKERLKKTTFVIHRIYYNKSLTRLILNKQFVVLLK